MKMIAAHTIKANLMLTVALATILTCILIDEAGIFSFHVEPSSSSAGELQKIYL